jgi:hypothetical protein
MIAKIDILKFDPLTEAQFAEASLHSGFTGGEIDDSTHFRFPFVMRDPNPWEKRRVDITITRHMGYPHYWIHVREEENYLLGFSDMEEEKGKLCWARPWRNIDNSLFFELLQNQPLRDQYYGNDICPFEANNPEEVRLFIENVKREYYLDLTQYVIRIEDHSGDTCYYTRDGD